MERRASLVLLQAAIFPSLVRCLGKDLTETRYDLFCVQNLIFTPYECDDCCLNCWLNSVLIFFSSCGPSPLPYIAFTLRVMEKKKFRWNVKLKPMYSPRLFCPSPGPRSGNPWPRLRSHPATGWQRARTTLEMKNIAALSSRITDVKQFWLLLHIICRKPVPTFALKHNLATAVSVTQRFAYLMHGFKCYTLK